MCKQLRALKTFSLSRCFWKHFQRRSVLQTMDYFRMFELCKRFIRISFLGYSHRKDKWRPIEVEILVVDGRYIESPFQGDCHFALGDALPLCQRCKAVSPTQNGICWNGSRCVPSGNDFLSFACAVLDLRRRCANLRAFLSPAISNGQVINSRTVFWRF